MATYYVSANGSNSNDGLSESAPWLTVAKFNSTATTGDRLLLRRGDTFLGQWVPKASQSIGEYGSNSVHAGLDGNDAVHTVDLAGVAGVTIEDVDLRNKVGSSTSKRILSIGTSCSGLTVRGVNFLGGVSAVLSDSGTTGSGNVFRGCRFERTWQDGVSLLGALAFLFDECTWWRTGADNTSAGAPASDSDPISAHETVTFQVVGSRFYGCARGAGLSVQTGTCSFDRCVIETTDETGSAGNYVFGIASTGRIDVTNCRIILGGTRAQYVFVCDGGGALNAYNNTIASANTNAGTIGLLGIAGTLTAKNNIIRIPTGTHAWDVTATAIVPDYNNFYPDGAAKFALLFDGVSAPLVTGDFAGWQSAGKDAHGIVTDPLLYNGTTPTTGTDLRLLATSPCRSAGVGGLVTVDCRNRTRITNEIGAWSKER